MIYFNILLSNEENQIEFIKYDWIDALSFTGGFVDIILFFIFLFFTCYNYKLNDIVLMQHSELELAKT